MYTAKKEEIPEGISTNIVKLGKPVFHSPLKQIRFVSDDARILYDVSLDHCRKLMSEDKEPASFELAGPREHLFFDPKLTKIAIVTCGGLCPGLNDVIRGLTMTAHYSYNIEEIYGIKYGYQGFIKKYGHNPIRLTPKLVTPIHELGGTILSSSRGPQPIPEIVDWLQEMEINILFTIGGDGTLRGALAISQELEKRNLKISIIGVPKTIDNDINFVEKTFGFQTAFSVAVNSIRSAHVEALGAPNGIGLVKLMGRYSGFIAAYATLALQDVNYILIPEIDFDLDGENGLLNQLKDRLNQKKHAVIVVAEGAGQKFFTDEKMSKDKSGNVKLGDIGTFLQDQIKKYFNNINMEVNLKYIDPSYLIRSVPATPEDSVFCEFLSQNAVHAGMTGRTNMIVGMQNNEFVYIPIELAVLNRKQVDPNGRLWMSVKESTGQGSLKNNL